MNEVIHDNYNPNWNGLETLVKTLNDELMKLAEFYFDRRAVTSLGRNKDALCTGTLNISKACLEVIDSTCVVMATMRSIVKKHVNDNVQDVRLSQNIGTDNFSGGLAMKESNKRTDNLAPILSLLEIALVRMNEANVPEQLLEVAVGKMRDVVNKEQMKGTMEKSMKQKAAKRNESSKQKHSYKKPWDESRK
jgi:hypothetical protein